MHLPVKNRRSPTIRPGCLRILWVVLPSIVLLAGCSGRQSALSPAGQSAQQIAVLFWWMVAGAALIWLIVIGLAFYAAYIRRGRHSRRQSALLIIGGGTVFPTIVLIGLLAYGLALIPSLMSPAPPGSLRIRVVGEQWWWRVHYEGANGESVPVANEIHLPVGEPVQFQLEAADVIHSFWIPSLAGKVDMIPGRINQLSLLPTKVGVYRGVCAEYCGASHALMNFDVVVEERAEFDAWIAHQADPANTPDSPDAAQGSSLFAKNGCGACHAVRGTSANGVVGPDLTHVGSRLSIGASLLPNEENEFHRWIEHTDTVKPEVIMPAYSMLPEEDLQAIAAYLEGLE